MANEAKRTDSPRERLLKAAVELMHDSGYAAVTSRKLAARAGLKPQLVHYYFKTMDDLFLEVYRNWALDLLERQEAILSSSTPFRDMWRLATSFRGVLLTEFIALANHRKSIRKEMADFGDRYRRSQIHIVSQVLERKGIHEFPWTPTFISAVLNSLAGGLVLESEAGVKEGHDEVLAVVEHFIERFDQQEPDALPATDAR